MINDNIGVVIFMVFPYSHFFSLFLWDWISTMITFLWLWVVPGIAVAFSEGRVEVLRSQGSIPIENWSNIYFLN